MISTIASLPLKPGSYHQEQQACDSEVGRPQAGRDLRGNLKSVALMSVKRYASCICIHHLALNLALSPGVESSRCGIAQASGSCIPTFPVAHSPTPNAEEAASVHPAPCGGPGRGHWVLVGEGEGWLFCTRTEVPVVSCPRLRPPGWQENPCPDVQPGGSAAYSQLRGLPALCFVPESVVHSQGPYPHRLGVIRAPSTQ